MKNYWKIGWQRWFSPESKARAEIDRIAALQQIAVSRRAEHAATQEKAGQTDDARLPGPLATSRKRMEEAELAHTLALRTWENRQSRQKSR